MKFRSYETSCSEHAQSDLIMGRYMASGLKLSTGTHELQIGVHVVNMQV